MSLRMKVMAVLLPVMALLLGGLYSLMSGVISRGFSEIEQTHMQRNIARVRAALEQEMQALRSTSLDWGSWTELYDWVPTRDADFIERSLALGSAGLDDLKLEFLAIRDLSGEYVFSEQRQPGADEPMPLSEAMRALLARYPKVSMPAKQDRAMVGFVVADGVPMLLAGAPVLDSDEALDSRGAVVMGRILDEDYLAGLSERVGLELRLSLTGNQTTSSDFVFAAQQLSTGQQPAVVQILDESTIAGYFSIDDIDGKPLALIRLSEDRAVHRQGQLSLRYLVIVFALAALAILTALILLLNNVVLRRILNLSDEVHRISLSSDLTLRTSASGHDEIGHLGREMNEMLQALEMASEREHKYIREIDASLKLAASIQSSMLAHDFSDGGELVDLHAALIPAKTVGGDFYDYFWLDERRIAFVIADVSGKGVPAGLFMVKAKTVIKTAARADRTPAEIIMRANDELSEGNDESMFVTALFGVLNTSSGHVELVSAGHNPPYIIDGESGVAHEKRLPEQVVLGAMDGIEYSATSLTIRPGDALFLYTDGVNEAMDPDNVEFGYERLLAVLQNNRSSAAEITASMIDAVHVFVREADQSDDITVMCLRWKAAGTRDRRRQMSA